MLIVISTIVAVMLAGLLEIVINVSREKRARQVLFPAIGLIYDIVAVIIILTKRDELLSAINSLLSILNISFDDSMIPYYPFLNLAVLIVFVLGKLIFGFIISLLCSNRKFLSVMTKPFYEYSDEYGIWFIKNKWANYRSIIGAVSLGLIAVIAISCGLSFAGGLNFSNLLAFPSVVIILVNEVFSFINGRTYEEFKHNILGDYADSRRISHFYKLREIYEHLLPKNILSAHTGCEFSSKHSVVELLNKLSSSDDVVEKKAAKYINIYDTAKRADADYILAMLKLLKRDNVIFANPFYRDLSLYMTLPIVNTLFSGKKCLVIVGRQSLCDDIKKWVEEMLSAYSHMDSLWRVKYLDIGYPDTEIGILPSAKLYDEDVIASNKPFFAEVDYVLMIEPSAFISTGQIGLSILSNELNKEEPPVYCACDRNPNGLVDTLSHLVHSEITNVVAMPLPRCMYTGMTWDMDGDYTRSSFFDKQTKFLGNGTELSAIAIKNQIQRVTWFSEKKVPVRDVKWIAGQYYGTICRFMNIPVQQQELSDRIQFRSNMWNSEREKESFIVVNDELNNVFLTMRAYLSRGIDQTFVNVISENYLLRDYMRCNKKMFFSDPETIPSLVPDYARTERNTLLKLLVMMSYREVPEEEVKYELSLTGIDRDDVFAVLKELLEKYTYADAGIFSISSENKVNDRIKAFSTNLYSVIRSEFDYYFGETLSNAYFIDEDESNKEDYIDAKLYGHVTQIILPGQNVTYDGKYYQVKLVQKNAGVILRRSSDLYNRSTYYRQIRTYSFDTTVTDTIVSLRTFIDIEQAFVRKDIIVKTSGYLEMTDNHDLRGARIVNFENDPSVGEYVRKYHYKTVYRLKLPDTNTDVRFLFCVLLSEVLRSVFPDCWQYIAVVTRRPRGIEGMLNYMVYNFDTSEDDEFVYIIEDSDLDLGLIDAIDKNFVRLMEIMDDFLEWHFEKLREPEQRDPIFDREKLIELSKRRRSKLNLLQRIAMLISGKKEEEVDLNPEHVHPGEETPETYELKRHEPFNRQTDEYEDDDDETDETEERKNSSNEDKEPIKLESDKSVESDTSESSDDVKDNDKSGEDTKDDDKSVDDTKDKEKSESAYTDGKNKSDKPDNRSGKDGAGEKAVTGIRVTGNSVAEKPKKVRKHFDHISDANDVPEISHTDGTDIFTNGNTSDEYFLESEFERIGITPVVPSRYQKECYLKFGFEDFDQRLKFDDLRSYLRARGYGNNSLTVARRSSLASPEALNTAAENCCDFCSLPLSGVSYDLLADGRVRCNNCSSSAINTVEEFRDLFFQILEMMECYFSVTYKQPISIQVADAKTVNKGAGAIFKPSKDYANRVLGYAKRSHGRFSILIENGSPRLATISTLVHELTHIWQYINWNDYAVNDIYPDQTDKLAVYEGMATWAEIQFLYQLGENHYASQQEAYALKREDVYGIGFKAFCKQYPLMKDSSLIRFSPFNYFPPVEIEK